MAGALREVMERNDVTNLEENLVSSQLLAEHWWPGPGIRYHAMVIETEANNLHIFTLRKSDTTAVLRPFHPSQVTSAGCERLVGVIDDNERLMRRVLKSGCDGRSIVIGKSMKKGGQIHTFQHQPSYFSNRNPTIISTCSP